MARNFRILRALIFNNVQKRYLAPKLFFQIKKYAHKCFEFRRVELTLHKLT